MDEEDNEDEEEIELDEDEEGDGDDTKIESSGEVEGDGEPDEAAVEEGFAVDMMKFRSNTNLPNKVRIKSATLLVDFINANSCILFSFVRSSVQLQLLELMSGCSFLFSCSFIAVCLSSISLSKFGRR